MSVQGCFIFFMATIKTIGQIMFFLEKLIVLSTVFLYCKKDFTDKRFRKNDMVSYS